MTTHERELTEPIDLCTADGTRVYPAALGWSRRPLHRANLDACFGRNKRWDYWAILAGDLVVSSVYADLDTFGLADVWWVDLVTGHTGGRAIVVASADVTLPAHPGTAPLHIDRDGLALTITDDARSTRLRAHWTEADGQPAQLDITVDQPRESLNVVIPWSDEVFNYTSKHQARAARGELTIGDTKTNIDDAWGVLDVGRGRWPHELAWNWGGGAGRVGAHVVGLQFGAKWTEGSGFTENGIIVDGRLSKLGNELEWTYEWNAPMQPWRVVDPGGQLDVTLTPRFDKHSARRRRSRPEGRRSRESTREDVDVSADLGSETHQVFGTWSGMVRTDDGVEVEFDALQGFAEEARQRW